MAFGVFSAAHVAVGQFVKSDLLAVALSIDAPTSVNILNRFTSFLQHNGFNSLSASEEAQKQETLLFRHIKKELDEWHALGVPAPVAYIDDNDRVLLTWKHRLFPEKRYRKSTFDTENYVEIYDWLTTLHNRDFLFACVLLLKLLDCDPIFVSDGSGDMGIDCVGKLSVGALKSIVIFVQAKTMQDPAGRITENTLRQEFTKYVMLKRSGKYSEYLNKLSVFQGRDGSAEVYVCITNAEFKTAAQKAANSLGILLRSKRQVALHLSLAMRFVEIQEMFDKIHIPPIPDLERNLATEMEDALSSS